MNLGVASPAAAVVAVSSLRDCCSPESVTRNPARWFPDSHCLGKGSPVAALVEGEQAQGEKLAGRSPHGPAATPAPGLAQPGPARPSPAVTTTLAASKLLRGAPFVGRRCFFTSSSCQVLREVSKPPPHHPVLFPSTPGTFPVLRSCHLTPSTGEQASVPGLYTHVHVTITAPGRPSNSIPHGEAQGHPGPVLPLPSHRPLAQFPVSHPVLILRYGH